MPCCDLISLIFAKIGVFLVNAVNFFAQIFTIAARDYIETLVFEMCAEGRGGAS